MSLFSALKERIVGKKKDARERLKQLRVDTADGKEVDPTEAFELLEECGVTPDEFEKQVKLLERRREMQKKVETGQRAGQVLPGVRDQLAAGEEELQRIIDDHRDRLSVLRSQRDKLNDAIKSGNNATVQLRETATDEDLLRSIEDLGKEIRELSDRLRAIIDKRQLLASNLSTVESTAHETVNNWPDTKVGDMLRTIDRKKHRPDPRMKAWQKEITKLNAEYDRIVDEKAALEVRRDELSELRLDPNAI